MADDPVRRIPTLALALIVPVIAVLAVVATQVVAGDGASSAARSGGGGANAIEIKNFAFVPPTVTVAPGTTITVTNTDGTTHTVTAGDKRFSTGNIGGGATGTFTAPTKPGKYPYICNIHQYMQGDLDVKG